MKTRVKIETEITVTEITMDLSVRYGEEDIPNDFPGRKGDMLSLTVDVDTGKIKDFPEALEIDVFMKVTDNGTYVLWDDKGCEVARREQDYVPHGLVPGEYGDYVDFKIKGGIIINWPKKPNLRDFFPEDN